MRILFVMDPLHQLNKRWDNSLAVFKELKRRGHTCSMADAPLLPRLDLKRFDLIIIRKEPPVNAAYMRMLALLERVANRVPIVNHPTGIRMTNEKLSILDFPKWIPKTIVTSSSRAVLRFQKKLQSPVVVKPLDQKGGNGVFLLKFPLKNAGALLVRATRNGRKKIMAQEFIKARKRGEKRIVILNGKFLAAYKKRARKGEFRANLDRGASFHGTQLSPRERRLLADLKPYLLKRGLYFVGIDVLEEKLIEINVTSPAGVTEAKFLHPKSRPVEAWADFLERFAPAYWQAGAQRNRS